jgi:hypothetical protein
MLDHSFPSADALNLAEVACSKGFTSQAFCAGCTMKFLEFGQNYSGMNFAQVHYYYDMFLACT